MLYKGKAFPTDNEIGKLLPVGDDEKLKELKEGMRTFITYVTNTDSPNKRENICNFLRKSYSVIQKARLRNDVGSVIFTRKGILFFLKSIFENDNSVSICYFLKYENSISDLEEGFYIGGIKYLIRLVQMSKIEKKSPKDKQKKIGYSKDEDSIVFLMSIHKDVIEKLKKSANQIALKFEMRDFRGMSVGNLLEYELLQTIRSKKKVLKISNTMLKRMEAI